MNITILYSKKDENELAKEVRDLLLVAENPPQINLSKIRNTFVEQIIAWEQIFSAIKEFRCQENISDDHYCVLLMSQKNEKDWFSAFDPSRDKSLFIQTSEWDQYLQGPLKYIIAYQILENILQLNMFGDFEEVLRHSHQKSIGCVNDFCDWRPDVSLKIRTGDICNECQQILNRRDVSPSFIKYCLQIFSNIRQNNLHCRDLLSIPYDDRQMPFTIATTKRKMLNDSDPLRRFLFLIDHFDSIIRTSVILFGVVTHKTGFAEFFKAQHLDERPSLGHWVSALQMLMNNANQGNNDRANYEFTDRIRMIVAEAEKANIVSIRNERRGHGYCDCHDNNYKSIYSQCQSSLAKIEELLKPLLIKNKLYYVIASERVSEQEFKVKVKTLMGSHPDFDEEIITIKPQTISEIPIAGKVYTFDSQSWQSLHPYLLYDSCPECRHIRVLIADGGQFLDPYIGHRVKLPHSVIDPEVF